MIQLHASKALFAKLPVDNHGALPANPPTAYLLERPSLSDSPLSGWQAHLFTLQRRQCVLWVHDATRFPLFMSCFTKPDFAQLQWHFVDTLMNTLLKAGATERQLATADYLLRPLCIDTVCSRSVQGTLSRMKGDVEHMLYCDQIAITDVSPYRTGVWLADRPTKVKDHKDWLWPQKAMFQLLDGVTIESAKDEHAQAEESMVNDAIANDPKVVSLNHYRKEHKR